MSSEQHDRLTVLFERALELSPDARGAFIDACTDDPALRSELSIAAGRARSDAEPPRTAGGRCHAGRARCCGSRRCRQWRGDPAGATFALREADLIGTTLAHYRVVSHLGSGGMGDVYVARDTVLDRSVALKVLPSEDAVTQHGMRRFVEEAKAASALNHPNIATIHELREADGVHFIVMEYVEGATLKARISRGPLDSSELIRLAIQIAHALDAATASASSTAISSRPTSWSRRADTRKCSTLASPSE